MQIELYDQVILDETSIRETRDGYLVAMARTARTGIQEYRAHELGLTDRSPDDIIRVYRPPEEVFAADALASLANRPITLDHPPEPVTAKNWKKYARGVTGADVVRDGEFVRQPLMLTDADAIRDVKSGKKQLSQGYGCELEFKDGITPEGESYHAVQKRIRGNHLAVCSLARGGSALRIGDARRETVEPFDGESRMPHVLMIDGLQVVDVSDSAKAAIEKLQGQVTALTTARDAAHTQIGELTATIQTKDGEIAGLNAKLKDAEVTPERLQQLADARAKVIAAAKKVGGEALVVDGKTDAEIRRAAVAAKLGDAATTAMSDAAIEGAFSALSAGAVSTAPVNDSLRDAIRSAPAGVVDTASIRDAARAARVN